MIFLYRNKLHWGYLVLFERLQVAVVDQVKETKRPKLNHR